MSRQSSPVGRESSWTAGSPLPLSVPAGRASELREPIPTDAARVPEGAVKSALSCTIFLLSDEVGGPENGGVFGASVR